MAVGASEIYVRDLVAPTRRTGRRLSVYLGLVVLLAAASLVAVTVAAGQLRSHHGCSSRGTAARARRRPTARSSPDPTTACR
jgi:hypothetical protein